MKPAHLFPNKRQIRLDLADLGLPEVPLVGIHRQTSAAQGLLAHTHEGLLEICYLVSGKRSYHVGGRHYVMRGNDVFLTFPDEVHGSGDRPHGKGELYWLQVLLPRRPKTFLALAGGDATGFIRALRQLPRRHFHGDRRLQYLFEDIFRLHHDAALPFRKLRVANAVMAWLLAVAECAARPSAFRESPDIQAALKLIAALPSREATIATLAVKVGLSESRFKAKFKEQTGIAPGEYILRQRIDRAKALLRDGRMPVTEVAFALGFASSQYFATVFKRFTTLRPSDLLRGNASPPDA
ncbi:MAG: hypothetical protein A3K19_18795 [Lentisphaerae bacterium RIFOXYB12_FULL_65_16]|nr:MAG: hypothetical protein A3K18_26245 [Lentisphaerae bacterium RIFOXYA12_64_32]OGV92472.1 MAG: hypothetical protein A3K19_18795 [Lentisphaerae bacterium RIFOXYB12_FULL_65_16]